MSVASNLYIGVVAFRTRGFHLEVLRQVPRHVPHDSQAVAHHVRHGRVISEMFEIHISGSLAENSLSLSFLQYQTPNNFGLDRFPFPSVEDRIEDHGLRFRLTCSASSQVEKIAQLSVVSPRSIAHNSTQCTHSFLSAPRCHGRIPEVRPRQAVHKFRKCRRNRSQYNDTVGAGDTCIHGKHERGFAAPALRRMFRVEFKICLPKQECVRVCVYVEFRQQLIMFAAVP